MATPGAVLAAVDHPDRAGRTRPSRSLSRRAWADREETLQALRALDPRLREALAQAAQRLEPRPDAVADPPQEAQIVPTELDLLLIYIPGMSNRIAPILVSPRMNWNPVTW